MTNCNAENKRPNVLLIVCDQWRYDSVGASGLDSVKTPNIDGIAEDGMFFENAYTPLPVCAPSRQAMISGVQPDSIGAFFNYNFIDTNGVDPEKPSWPMKLKEAGYTLALSGKWSGSPDGGPEAFGYEVIADEDLYDLELERKYPDADYKNGWFGDPSPIAYEDSPPAHFSRCAAEFIRQNKDRPWHLWLDFPQPHLPCRPSEPFSGMYSPDGMKPWPSFGDTFENKPYIQKRMTENWSLDGLPWESFARTKALYFGMISEIDYSLGAVFDALRESGQMDSTLIIITADHGDTCGGHGMLDKHYILYDDVIHVPFIVRYPALGRGRSDKFMSSSLDIAPTVEHFCDLEPSGERHGHSVSEYISGEVDTGFAVSTSNGQQFGLYTQRCIRTAEYKLIWNMTDIDEFYVLHDDPGEKCNLINDERYAEVRAELGKKLYSELIRRGDPFASEWVRWQIDPSVRKNNP